MRSSGLLSIVAVISFFAVQTDGYEGGYKGYADFDRVMEGLSAEYGNGGCTVSALKAGEIVYNYGTGELDIDADTHVMRVASLSKSVAATALLKAIEEDVKGYGITVDSTIYDALENDADRLAIFQKFSTLNEYLDVITLKQLMSMSGGFRHYEALDEYLWEPDTDILDEVSILEQYLSLFGDDDLFCEPGTCYKYSSFGYYIVAELVDVLSDVDFYTFLNERIFGELGLTFTGDMNSVDRTTYASQYKRVCDQIDRSYKFTADCELNATYSDIGYDEIVYYKKGAGNVLSTSLEFAIYVDNAVWNRNGFLSDSLHTAQFSGQTFSKGTSPTDDWYGYGWHMYGETDPNIIWHTGGAVGGVTIVRVTKDLELVVTVFCDIQSQASGIYAMIGAAEEYFGEGWTAPTTTTDDESMAVRAPCGFMFTFIFVSVTAILKA